MMMTMMMALLLLTSAFTQAQASPATAEAASQFSQDHGNPSIDNLQQRQSGQRRRQQQRHRQRSKLDQTQQRTQQERRGQRQLTEDDADEANDAEEPWSPSPRAASGSTNTTTKHILALLPCTVAKPLIATEIGQPSPSSSAGQADGQVLCDMGISHAAAIDLALRHFHQGDSFVVGANSDQQHNDSATHDIDVDIDFNVKVHVRFLPNDGSDEQSALRIALDALDDLAKSSTTASQDAAFDALLLSNFLRPRSFLEWSALAEAWNVPLLVIGGGYQRSLAATASNAATMTMQAMSEPSTQPTTDAPTHMTTRLSIDAFSLATAASKYLQYIHRSKYVALLHATNPTSINLHEAMLLVRSIDAQTTQDSTMSVSFNLDAAALTQRVASTFDAADNDATSIANIDDRSIASALQEIFDRGFLTIVWIVEDVWLELPYMAKIAEQKNMMPEDGYVWTLIGDVGPEALLQIKQRQQDFVAGDSRKQGYDRILRLIMGSAIICPVEGFIYNADRDPFLKAWRASQWEPSHHLSMDDSILNSVQREDYFQTTFPSSNSAYVYDATISLAKALHQSMNAEQTNNDNSNSTSLVPNDVAAYIRRLKFDGATGHVKFHQSGWDEGERFGSFLPIAIFNLFRDSMIQPGTLDEEFDEDESSQIAASNLVKSITDVLLVSNHTDNDDRQWQSVRPFVYFHGALEPPSLLRRIVNENHLEQAARVYGFTLFTLSMILHVSLIAWVFWKRETKALKAAQPEFLYVLIVGSMCLCGSIISNSFDESYGWTPDELGRACTSSPWLIVIGFTLIYSALWCKLWRIQKVLQFSRKKTTALSVIGPASALLFVVIVTMAAWTVMGGFDWRRTVVDELTGETTGNCKGDGTVYWFTPIFLVMLIPPVLTMSLVWKTRDIDNKYAETRWIFSMIIAQFQLLMISIPVILFVDDKSTTVRYVGQSSVFFLFSITTITLIFAPKLYYVHFRKEVAVKRSKRGSSIGQVRVSGATLQQGSGYCTCGARQGYGLSTNFSQYANNSQAESPSQVGRGAAYTSGSSHVRASSTPLATGKPVVTMNSPPMTPWTPTTTTPVTPTTTANTYMPSIPNLHTSDIATETNKPGTNINPSLTTIDESQQECTTSNAVDAVCKSTMSSTHSMSSSYYSNDSSIESHMSSGQV